MGPSSPRTPCSPGRRTTGSSGISLRQEGLLREFQRAHTRRASQREPVPRPRSCPDQDHELGRRLQPATAALSAGLSHTGSLSHQSVLNTRSSAKPRPAPPIACCSTCAQGRKTRRGSNRLWIKVQWQVKISVGGQDSSKSLSDHVRRNAGLDLSVLTNKSWYETLPTAPWSPNDARTHRVIPNHAQQRTGEPRHPPSLISHVQPRSDVNVGDRPDTTGCHEGDKS